MKKFKFIKRGIHFRLIDFSKPIINKNTMIHDNKIGGILLKYKVKDVFYVTLFKRNTIILNKAPLGIYSFFNPLKAYWRTDAYRISKIDWGRKQRLLTKLWLEVGVDFKDINSIATSDLKSIQQCKNKPLIQELTSHNENFIMSNFKQTNQK